MLTWQFFKRSSHKTDCDFAQNALTAAFDGEAGAAQLLRAQKHRARCARCRLLWGEWEKTGALLRAVPAPIAPAPLREQILVACRALPDEDLVAAQNEFETANAASHAALIAYLESPDDEFAMAQLASFAPALAPPPTLSAQILQRTTQAETPLRASLWPAVCAFFQAGSTPKARAPLAVRWSFGLAAPALAAWLIFIAQSSFVEIPAPGNARVFTTAPSAKTAGKTNLKTAVKTAAPVTPKTAGARAIQKPAPQIAALPRANADAPKTLASVSPATVRASSEFASPQIAKVSLSNSGKNSSAVVRKTTQKNSAKIRSPRAVPLVDKSISAPLPLSRVSFGTSALRLHLKARHHFGQDAEDRISSPALVTSSALAPRLADARLADGDFDESLSAVARQRDNRPEDLGRALDEYSASLLAENTDENDEDDWS